MIVVYLRVSFTVDCLLAVCLFGWCFAVLGVSCFMVGVYFGYFGCLFSYGVVFAIVFRCLC